jgi:hypothetical protein
VGRNQRREIAAVTAKHHRRSAVIRLREAQPAKLRRYFNTEGAHAREAVNYLLWDFASPVDLIWINVLFQKCFELQEKWTTVIAVFRTLHRKWMNPSEIKSTHKKATGETAFRLRRLPC